MAPSLYLNQCWLFINEALWHSSKGYFKRSARDIYHRYEFENYWCKMITLFPSGQWVTYCVAYVIARLFWFCNNISRGKWSDCSCLYILLLLSHSHISAPRDDVIKWKHFLRYWPFVRGIHRSPVNSPHKGRWHGALVFSLICAWINDRVNNRDPVIWDAHYDVIVMWYKTV